MSGKRRQTSEKNGGSKKGKREVKAELSAALEAQEVRRAWEKREAAQCGECRHVCAVRI